MSGIAVNNVVIGGNLTADPELRYTPQGTAVMDLRMAINSKRGQREEVLYIDATVWAKTAEACADYLKKGSAVLVVGRLVMEEWTDKQSGSKRSKVKVQAESVQFLDRKGQGDGERRAPRERPPRQEARQESPAPAANDDLGASGAGTDSEVPFYGM